MPPPPSEPSDFRLFLQEELLRRCRANPRYSLRAFAKTLATDHSTLAKLVAGKRPIGRRTIERLGERLGLSPAAIARMTEKKAPASRAAATADAGVAYRQMTLDAFHIISDWYHLAILELMRVDGFSAQPRWVARALGITVNEVNAAVDRLVRVGMLEVRADGTWHDQTGGRNTNIGGLASTAAHRALQKQILQKAIAALDEVPVERRNQTAMTMAVDVDRLPEAVERIKVFRREMAQFLSRGERRDEVYNLSVSLYPITSVRQRARNSTDQIPSR
jgi:uncharacterized protein (TIGR02147 family)